MTDDFEERLRSAIERGHRRHRDRQSARRAEAMTAEELKRLHTQYRLELSDHIENCVRRLPTHFPGFQFATIFGDRGWGAGCSRDDLRMSGGRRSNDYSRLEMVVRPFSDLGVLDLAAKGTIRNKEVFARNFFEKLHEADVKKYRDLIDFWVLEYAELYAAK